MERIEWAARLGIGADADGAGLFLVVHVHQHRTKGVVALYEWVEGQGDPFISYAEDAGRSEEHTSELQSLMRISYAVFCLKKKNNSDSELPQQLTTKLNKYIQNYIIITNIIL